jgi:hypothetical protein
MGTARGLAGCTRTCIITPAEMQIYGSHDMLIAIGTHRDAELAMAFMFCSPTPALDPGSLTQHGAVAGLVSCLESIKVRLSHTCT